MMKMSNDFPRLIKKIISMLLVQLLIKIEPTGIPLAPAGPGAPAGPCEPYYYSRTHIKSSVISTFHIA